MPEGGNLIIDGPSRPERRKVERTQFAYVTWRDHLAAPGSRFAPDGAEPTRPARIDAASRQGDAAIPERRAA